MDRSESEALERFLERVETTLSATGATFPYYASPSTGEWVTTEDGNWCGGHWVGMLWLAYQYTGAERYARAARNHTERMMASLPERTMFYGMNCHYAGYRALDVTDDAAHRAIGRRGADAMVEFFHEGARQVPLGTLAIESSAPEFRGPADDDEGPGGDRLGAVDAAYVALSVLWRAYRETNERRYRDTAIAHVDRHIDWYVRDDGSTWHHAEFDPETGDLVRQYNELAYSNDTCWARGQGWCIAGLARAYRETGADRYLDALESVVEYYLAEAPPDLVPYWDFEHPDRPDVPRDTSAAVLAAYGLVRLPEAERTGELVETGERILASLLEGYLTPLDPADDRPAGMVLEGCYNGPAGFADEHELVWTDYYLMRALASRVAIDDLRGP